MGEHYDQLKNEIDMRKALRQARQKDQEHKMAVASSQNELPLIQEMVPSLTVLELLSLTSKPTESVTISSKAQSHLLISW